MLRPLTASDVTETYLAWLRDPQVTRFLEARHEPQTRENIEHFVNQFDGVDRILFGIFTDGRHVGNVAVRRTRYNTADVSFMIGDRTVWGQGVGTAAVARAVDYGFDVMDVRKLHGGAHASNLGSRRIFERLRFVEEGRLRQHVVVDGRPEDTVVYGLLAEERTPSR